MRVSKLPVSLIIFTLLFYVTGVQAACTAANPRADLIEDTPTADFTDHGDGTITHALTGLMWKQCSEGLSGSGCSTGSATTMAWSTALQAATTDTTAGHSDWRLPNQRELLSIVELCGWSPAINLTVFPNTPALTARYWSAVTHNLMQVYALDVDFGFGFENMKFKLDSTSYVRLVRGGQPLDTFDREGPPAISKINTASDTGDAMLDEGEYTAVAITQLLAHFSKDVVDPTGNTDINDVTNPANYLLIQDGVNGSFDTVNCATGLSGDDVSISIDSVSYDSTGWIATLDINSSAALSVDAYRLLVCGSTSIEDSIGNKLDGNYDRIGGDDYALNFHVDLDTDTDGITNLNDADDDNDGLSDVYEIASGLDPLDATGVNGADGDPDSDGVSNLNEFTAGSDPNDINSSPGILALTISSLNVNEGDGTANLTVSRSGGTFGAVSVSCITNDQTGAGKATVFLDYTGLTSSNTLSWADGESGSKTCVVSVSDDADVEIDETVQLDLSSSTGGAVIGSPNTILVTIQDNEVSQVLDVQKILAADGAYNDRFGNSVSVYGDTALVGAWADDDNGNNSGSAYIYLRDGSGNWAQQAKLIAADGASGGAYFGYSVSLYGDTALVGAYRGRVVDGGDRTGSAYIFKRDGSGNWAQQAKLIAADGAHLDVFGFSVSLSEDTALVGAYRDDDNGDSSGSAYIFLRDVSGNWAQQAKLLAADGALNDSFGYSVSLDGDNALVGASGDDVDSKGVATGSAYIYQRDISGNWSQQEKLTAADGAGSDFFGTSVSLSGDTAIVGAYYDDDKGPQSGSAYVYQQDGSGNWLQQTKLTASDGSSEDNLGISVSLSADTALVGAWGNDNNGNDTGAAYIYQRNSVGNWTQQSKLAATDGASADWFGVSVSLYGSRALVAALYDDDKGSDSGSAYIMDLDLALDNDGDGVINILDGCPTGETGWSSDGTTDFDGDGCRDSTEDAFPMDASEWLDTDGDYTGNNADTDDDNDGILDVDDAYPLDANNGG